MTGRMTTGLAPLAARLLLGLLGVLAVAPAVGGENAPEARFHGAPTYDFGVTNVKWEAGTKDYSFVTFDLSWSYSWRVKWTEPAKTSVTGKDLEVENWDAAWVFVKFLPDKDAQESKERNHWQHATLDQEAANHVMPAGATNTVKLSDDGARGMGVFIYRDAIGHGRNDWKGIKLRWLHGAGKVDPAKAAVAVHAIAMVYVPAGPFKIGAAAKSGFSPFADGPDVPITRYDGEQAFGGIPGGLRTNITNVTKKDGGPYLMWDEDPRNVGAFTDGAWRGGLTIPFLLDKEWNGPSAEGTRSRQIGPVAGWLWGTHTFSERGGGATFGGEVGGTTTLDDDYPTGYDAFYCMKYDVTQGQYVDYLNSLPPDVAAGRAFVSSEESASYGSMPSLTVKDKLPSGEEIEVTELAGNTIRSSADRSARPAGTPGVGAETKEKDDMDLLIEDAMTEKKNDGTKIKPAEPIPVYWARCPFRRLQGFCWDDIRAFAVWAGLRPMTGLETMKANGGARDPSAPPPPPSSYDTKGSLEMADAGQPNERPIKGLSRYGADYGVRVGCFLTPTSDQATARATYWGISELACMTVPLFDSTFRGSHGNGIMSAGKPGAPWKRGLVAFTNTPPDWGSWDEYYQRHPKKTCRLAVSAGNRILKPAGEQAARSMKPKLAALFPPAAARRDDIPRVANVKVEPGKEYSTVSFDLSWQNSWRAKWEEPAEKNVTGKPLAVESWDAAWVFVKFRPAGAKDDLHATLAAQAADHAVPPAAALDVGLTDDGNLGTGVFVYRQAVGSGPNDFKNVKLRWSHGEKVDPGKVELKVHALGMVYVPEGPFASRSPWGHPLTVIATPNATQPGGHLESGTNTVPQNDEWPNGYPAFYCMKYSITQGQYVELLNSMPSGNYSAGRYGALGDGNARRYSKDFYNYNGYTITTNTEGVFKADVPDRSCNLLSLPDILSFTAWAGLRPPTNLEYEKACRGPRAVASGAEAWAPATCAPAVGLDKTVVGNTPAVGPGPSYWGIRELSLSGCVQEWPASLIQNEPVDGGEKAKGCGVAVRGLHGNGSPEVLEEWPWTCFGEWYFGGIWRLWAYGTVGHWIDASELPSRPLQWSRIDANRTGRYGARAVRTAPAKGDQESPLAMDPLPNLAGYDVGICYLSGRFRNDGEKPLKVELTSPLPAACFPDGAASRAFTAAPKAVTPFKILTAVTRQTAAGAVRRGALLPVRLQAAGGRVLADSRVKLALGSSPPPAVGTLAGGAVTLRLVNAAAQPVTAALTLEPPPEVKATEKEKRVEVGAKAEAQVSFAIPRQFVAGNAVCRLPYRVTVAKGAPQDGETAVELQVQSRWWLTRRVAAGPKLETPDEPGAGDGDELGMGDIVSAAGDVLKHTKPPKGWEAASAGAKVPLGQLGALPAAGSLALAATRVQAPADREAVLELQGLPVKEGKPAELVVLVWLNDEVVHDSRADAKAKVKPCRLRRGGNTLVVECRSAAAAAVKPVDLGLQFLDAKDGKPLDGLVFDIEQRP